MFDELLGVVRLKKGREAFAVFASARAPGELGGVGVRRCAEAWLRSAEAAGA
jgi:hypothetical protein